MPAPFPSPDEAWFGLAVDAARLGTWDWRPQTGEIHWSPRLRQIFGVAPDFCPEPGSIERLVHPDDRARRRACLDRMLDPAGDGRLAAESRIQRPSDGEERWISTRGQAYFDGRRCAVRVLGTTLDVTERKRREATAQYLSEAAALLASSLDDQETFAEICRLAVPRFADWVVVTLISGDGLETVAAAHRQTVMSELAREAVRREGLARFCPLAAVRQGEPILVREADAGATAAALADPALAEDLRRLGLRSYMVVPMVARERSLGAITLVSSGRCYGEVDLEVATQLGRHAALAVDNARLYRDVRAAVRQRDDVIAIVSHDLRNPLAAIVLASGQLAQLVAGTNAEELGRRQVEIIQRSAGRMDQLLRDLLDMAGLRAGRLRIDPAPAAVVALVEEAIEGLSARAALLGISLAAEGLEAAAGLCVRADRGRILQVLGNLAGNALKFCGRGSSVRVSARPEGPHVRFTVRDDGPGISPEEQPQIFAAYWSPERHRHGGTGLGLYISKGIVEGHGGRLWVESEPGKGSAFHFTLPRA